MIIKRQKCTVRYCRQLGDSFEF